MEIVTADFRTSQSGILTRNALNIKLKHQKKHSLNGSRNQNSSEKICIGVLGVLSGILERKDVVFGKYYAYLVCWRFKMRAIYLYFIYISMHVYSIFTVEVYAGKTWHIAFKTIQIRSEFFTRKHGKNKTDNVPLLNIFYLHRHFIYQFFFGIGFVNSLLLYTHQL